MPNNGAFKKLKLVHVENAKDGKKNFKDGIEITI